MLLSREGNHRNLPSYLEAKTLRGLFNKIKTMQRESKSEYKFINFYYDSDKKNHVAWYYKEITLREEIKEITDELIKQ